jgi:phosphoribosylformimino-5-aminoimidazole carboxamide ribotide isomerase
MEVLPAIDLLGGKCVRLVQGRFDRVIEYEQDPVEVANRFRGAGAHWIHVVDLEGARCGRIMNLDALQRIAATGARVEFGGGVRDEKAIRAALDTGVERVIIGTRALEDWEWFESVVHQPQFLNRLSLGLDARLGKLAIHGWTKDTQQTAVEVAQTVADWPLATICYTDIGRDGMLLGPNVEAIRALVPASAVPVVAAGGVTDLEDVRRLAQLNLEAIVIGRAIYEEGIDLKDALEVAYRGDERP